MRCDLLMTRRDELDAVARLIERIEHADVAVAANAEHVGNVVGNQVFCNEFGALHACHRNVLGSIGRCRAIIRTATCRQQVASEMHRALALKSGAESRLRSFRYSRRTAPRHGRGTPTRRWPHILRTPGGGWFWPDRHPS